MPGKRRPSTGTADTLLRRADQHGQRHHGHRLDARIRARLAMDSAPVRFESPSPDAVVSRLWWPKAGGSAPSASNSAICTPRIGDMVVAADDMRDPELDVVDHRRKRVEIAAVLAHQHRIGDARRDRPSRGRARDRPNGLRCARGANGSSVEIGQQEAPVRLAAFRLEVGLLGVAELQRLAAIDRRQPPRQTASCGAAPVPPASRSRDRAQPAAFSRSTAAA